MGLINSLIVWIINKYSKNGFYKYIPPVLFYIFAAGAFIKGNWFSISMEDLGYKGLAVILLASGLVGQIAAVMISMSKTYREKRQIND